MKWVKIAALVMLVLAAMRVVSWTFGWAAMKGMPNRLRLALCTANVAAFGLFAVLLLSRLSPGEPPDYDALASGLLVFAIYYAIDLRWTPWKRRTAVDNT